MAQYESIRRVYFDLDDVVFNSSPVIQYHVSKKYPQFSTELLNLKEGNLVLWQKCLELALLETEKAKREGRVPELFLPFTVGKNDIIRDVNNQKDDYDISYQKPIIKLSQFVKLAKHDLDMFFENRDATLEADGKLVNGVIPYDEIYDEKNWMPYVKKNINDLYKVFGSERLIGLTAHNGIDDNHGREFEAKVDAIHKMNPNIKVYGLRFHPYEHRDDGKRRPRALKSSAIKNIEGLKDNEDLSFIVGIDDSPFNNGDIYDNGGIPIFINSIGSPNERGFAMAKSLRAKSIFRELNALHLDGPKEKVLRKVR